MKFNKILSRKQYRSTAHLVNLSDEVWNIISELGLAEEKSNALIIEIILRGYLLNKVPESLTELDLVGSVYQPNNNKQHK